MPVEEMIEAPGDEQHAGEDAEGVGVDRHAERHHRVDDDGNRRRMPQRDRNQRDQHDPSALPIEAERHGKQPAHGRVEPVKRAERDQNAAMARGRTLL